MGSCPREHSAECREEWNKLSDREKEQYGYERDLKRWLDRLRAELEKRKEANLARIKGLQKKIYSQQEQSSLDAMAKQIEELLLEAQNQGEQGDVDAAESLVEQAEGVRHQRNTLKNSLDNQAGGNVTKGLVQTICPVSGLILNDEEARLRDHHSGRNYNAWKKVHEKHEELVELFSRRKHKLGKSERRSESRSPEHRERETKRSDHGRQYEKARRHNQREISHTQVDKEDSSEEEGQVT